MPVDSIRISGADLSLFFEESLRQDKCTIPVHGSSMHPYIRSGDTVDILPVQDGMPGFGDIVAVSGGAGGAPVMHRIAGVRQVAGETEFLLKGDNCFHSEGWLSSSLISGIVVGKHCDGRIRRFGYEGILLAALSRVGLLCLFVRLAGWPGRYFGRRISGERLRLD